MTVRLARLDLPRSLGSRLPLVRHLVEMMIAMHVGMGLGALLFVLAVGSGADAAQRDHAVAYLLVMAFSMTVPMVAWMLYRGHSRRSAAEMAAVMVAPALPLVALKLAHVVAGPVSGAYMCSSMVAMIALIVYRRGDYRAAATG